jgi:hypothetical protein
MEGDLLFNPVVALFLSIYRKCTRLLAVGPSGAVPIPPDHRWRIAEVSLSVSNN